MWVKILGTVCVAVFIGAAVVEYKQLRHRHAGHGEPEGEAAGEPTEAVQDDE